MDSDYASLSQGVFVIPFQSEVIEPEAGPSKRRRPSTLEDAFPHRLKKLYEESCKRCEEAQQENEQYQRDAQVDCIRDWLEACDASRLLKRVSSSRRLPIGIIQDFGLDLSAALAFISRAHTLQPGIAPDLGSAIRDIAIGFSDGEVSYSKTSGVAGLEELERHHALHQTKHLSRLLLYIPQAQSISSAILSELLYVLGRHSSLPFRVLLSVPSISLFTSNLHHIDPTLIDLSILRPPMGRRKQNPVMSLTQSLDGHRGGSSLLSRATLDELGTKVALTGGDSFFALKALKWLLLRASTISPIADTMDADGSALLGLQAIVDARRASSQLEDDPLKPLMGVEAESSQVLESVLDPAPRIAILKALADPKPFMARAEAASTLHTPLDVSRLDGPGSNAAGPSRRRRRSTPESQILTTTSTNDDLVDHTQEKVGGDLAEIETLFALYASAGRTINLWDWLQGFEDSVIRSRGPNETDTVVLEKTGDDVELDGAGRKRKRMANGDTQDMPNGDSQAPSAQDDGGNTLGDKDGTGDRDDEHEHEKEHEREDHEIDENEQDGLHSTFIRFCEEARMMGLLRARGRTVRRGADEVIKGVGFV